jgi:hypothetical protein
MKFTKIRVGALALAVLLLSACGDDEKTTPKNEFDFGNAVSLQGANLYLVFQKNDDDFGHMYREYIITDGTYNDNDAWNVDSYADATYVIGMQVGVPLQQQLAPGDYPLYESFEEAPETSNIGWVSFDTNELYYFTPEGAQGEEKLKLSGSFDNGDTMIISYTGPLELSGDDTEDDIDGTLYFMGKVQDVRNQTPARSGAE